jgi:hypothetical protein
MDNLLIHKLQTVPNNNFLLHSNHMLTYVSNRYSDCLKFIIQQHIYLQIGWIFNIKLMLPLFKIRMH